MRMFQAGHGYMWWLGMCRIAKRDPLRAVEAFIGLTKRVCPSINKRRA